MTSDGDLPGPITLAAVDIGTNSIHLVVARIHTEGTSPRFEVIEREKEMVRLGSGGGDMKQLDPDAIDRGIDVLRRFRRLAEVHGAEIGAVATSAVREAQNRDAFLARARDEAGVTVRVVSGTEEARLIHLGVLQAVPLFARRLVLCDIGGGSTELLVGERGESLAARSLKLGALRLTRRFFEGERLHPAAVDSCRRHVRSMLAPFAREVRRLEPEVLVGSSGTITSLATMAVQLDSPTPVRTLNNLVLSRAALDEVVARLVAAPTVAARARLPGLERTRADIILAGALILEQVMAELEASELTVSDFALREGLLLDLLRRRYGGTLHHLSDLRRSSVEHLVQQLDDDPGHAAAVARLALELFDATAVDLGLEPDDRELLEAAALLSNVGQFVSHSSHHKHSYYLIRNSEHLTGFSDDEIECIALVARYHRKSAPKAKHPEFAALGERDQARVRALAGVLRLAIGLDRRHASGVSDLEVERTRGRIVVHAHRLDHTDIDLEVYAANARSSLLADALGKEVVVTAS